VAQCNKQHQRHQLQKVGMALKTRIGVIGAMAMAMAIGARATTKAVHGSIAIRALGGKEMARHVVRVGGLRHLGGIREIGMPITHKMVHHVRKYMLYIPELFAMVAARSQSLDSGIAV